MTAATEHYPAWYTVPEIAPAVLYTLLEPIYNILEGRSTSKSAEDPFAKHSWMAFYGQTQASWEEELLRSQKKKAFTMAWGNFHQNLMGSFPGWANYGIGHPTGCDIGKQDETCVCEIKNNINTMNSSSKESVLGKLKKQKALGKRVLLIEVNGDKKQKEIEGVIIMSGREFYQELSGRASFMDSLDQTLGAVFQNYKSFQSLKDSL
jgi:hypothetical protein